MKGFSTAVLSIALFGHSTGSTPCPSDECWEYHAESKSCNLKAGCTTLSCDSTGIKATFTENVFGVDNNVNGISVGGVLPISDGLNGYTLTCPLGECGMTHEVVGNDQDGHMLLFKIKVDQDGTNRARTDVMRYDNIISLGQLTLLTAPHGVGITYQCAYPMLIELSSTPFSINQVIIQGSIISTSGTLADGFVLKAIDQTLHLGAIQEVALTWSVSIPDIDFYFSECSVEDGVYSINIIEDSCYAGALSVKGKPSSSPREIKFEYKTFMLAGTKSSSGSQVITCDIKLCKVGSCPGKATSDAQCPPGVYQYRV